MHNLLIKKKSTKAKKTSKKPVGVGRMRGFIGLGVTSNWGPRRGSNANEAPPTSCDAVC